MLRFVQHLIGRAHLHQFSMLHHRHTIGDVGNHAEIMGDEQNTGIVAGLKLFDQLEDLCLGGDVESGGRLIGNQNFGIQSERHRDHRALALAARKLVRIAVDDMTWIREVNIVEQLDGPLAPLPSGSSRYDSETPHRSDRRWS